MTPKIAPKPKFWRIAQVAILGVLVALCAALVWARFAVTQKAGFTPIPWALRAGPSLPTQIQAHLDVETRSNPNILGQSLHIIAPRIGLDQSFVSGPGVEKGSAIRVASNIKPFVAAAALKLVEMERLSLDAPIGPYLAPSVQELFTGKEAVLSKITLRHLLTNTSGLQDYGNSQLFQGVAYVPTAFGIGWPWTAESQVWVSLNLLPIGPAGQQFDYADTNYLLASNMIAKAMGTTNPGNALAELLDWGSLGATQTFWEGYQPAPPNTRFVRHFRGMIEDTNLDVSFDRHGGGGLVMSIADLAKTHRAVVRGDVFGQPILTSALMQTPSGASGAGTYGMGISSQRIGGVMCYTHGGRWGTMALHCPALDLTIARSTGQANAGPYDGVSTELVEVLKALPRTK